jgi:hypothetical protein
VAPSSVVKDATLAVITELAQLKVKVVACVADNAANLQAIANPVADDDLEHDDPLLNSVRAQMPLMLRRGACLWRGEIPFHAANSLCSDIACGMIALHDITCHITYIT